MVYRDLGKRTAKRKTYGDGILEVTKEKFCKYALQVTVKSENFPMVTEFMNGYLAVTIVPAEFCSVAYINDAPCDEGDLEYHR